MLTWAQRRRCGGHTQRDCQGRPAGPHSRTLCRTASVPGRI